MFEWKGMLAGWESTILFVLLLFLLIVLFAPGRRPPNFPPGLPMLPLLGSLLHMQGISLRGLLRKLKKEYGNMASFGVFGTGVVLVSKMSIIKEVYSHKASAGRPPMILGATRNYLLSDGKEGDLGLLGGTGPHWVELRRFLLRHLRDFGIGKTSCEPMIRAEVEELLEHIKNQNGQPIVMEEEIENYRSKKDWENIHSLLTLYLTEMKKYNGDHPIFNEHQLRAVMFEMFAAGMATTASTLTMGMYLVAKHPDVQQRVHQELDEVIGRERLPCYADLESLPYTRATIHEVQRVLNLIAFVVHCALEDCNFEGYDIPKGTVFLANMEDAMTDPKLWKNPDEFDPNNFLDDNGKYVKNGAFVPFGIGKRQCVGEALARMEVFVFLSSLFQKFTFTLVGEEVPPGNLYTFNAPVEFNAVAHVRPHL
ncbi:cytochrome P450 2J3 isoform X2 [Cherax quadricarinatus]|uniref:cytochrome P450 2J3 isoform X2 n=1 Tax=Cherax quadricarinatus TaxID=27406 RepID=UPI00387E40BE